MTRNNTRGPIRVLMVSSRADHGGGPRHIELLLKHLDGKIDPFVACPDEEPYRSRFEHLTGKKIFAIPHRRLSILAALKLADYSRHQKIDIIHAHGKGAGPYARLVSLRTNRPSIHTPHGVHVTEYGALRRHLYRIYENWSSSWIRHIIYVSTEEQKVASGAGLWIRVPHSVIVNGVDEVGDETKLILRIGARRKLGVSNSHFVVVTVTRFDYQKNMKEAYQVAKLAPNCLFVWVGHGREAGTLRCQAKKENVGNICFLGDLDDPLSTLASADVYFSSSRGEGLPLAPLEAMSLGIPVIASDVTGHRELIVQTQGGLLYPPGDPLQAAQHIARLASDGELRQRIGRQALGAQRRLYSATRMASSVYELYKQVAGRN